jgi:hypothetical protein
MNLETIIGYSLHSFPELETSKSAVKIVGYFRSHVSRAASKFAAIFKDNYHLEGVKFSVDFQGDSSHLRRFFFSFFFSRYLKLASITSSRSLMINCRLTRYFISVLAQPLYSGVCLLFRSFAYFPCISVFACNQSEFSTGATQTNVKKLFGFKLMTL